jgi:hypothetical protein
MTFSMTLSLQYLRASLLSMALPSSTPSQPQSSFLPSRRDSYKPLILTVDTDLKVQVKGEIVSVLN